MIRFGIIGASGIAKKFKDDIKHVDNAEITAVSARNKEKAEEYKNVYGVNYAFGSYEALCQSDVIDAVYIATPHNFHKEQALLALNNEKHVLLEKPITVNSTELRELILAAKKNNVLLMEAMWTLFLPISKKIKDIVTKKIYGDIKHIDIQFGYDLFKHGDETRRWLNKDLAAGSLLDMGIYPVHYFLWLIDDDIIDIKSSCTWTKTKVDKTTQIDIKTRGNVSVTLQSSMGKVLSNNCVVTFENGTKITVVDFSRPHFYFINQEKYSMPFIEGGFQYQIESFAKTIELGETENNIMTHVRSLAGLSLIDKVRKQIDLIYPFETLNDLD